MEKEAEKEEEEKKKEKKGKGKRKRIESESSDAGQCRKVIHGVAIRCRAVFFLTSPIQQGFVLRAAGSSDGNESSGSDKEPAAKKPAKAYKVPAAVQTLIDKDRAVNGRGWTDALAKTGETAKVRERKQEAARWVCLTRDVLRQLHDGRGQYTPHHVRNGSRILTVWRAAYVFDER